MCYRPSFGVSFSLISFCLFVCLFFIFADPFRFLSFRSSTAFTTIDGGDDGLDGPLMCVFSAVLIGSHTYTLTHTHTHTIVVCVRRHQVPRCQFGRFHFNKVGTRFSFFFLFDLFPFFVDFRLLFFVLFCFVLFFGEGETRRQEVAHWSKKKLTFIFVTLFSCRWNRPSPSKGNLC